MIDKNQNSIDHIRNMLKFQFDTSCKLLEMHLDGLEDDECLWKPCAGSLHIDNESGNWRADWPETETYDIGVSSIAWVTWHIILWWSMVFDYSFGNGTLTREDVYWPGSMEAVSYKIYKLRDEWKTVLKTISNDELLSCEKTKWPFEGKPFYELAAWLNLELMKNSAEIGYGRFLYASRKHSDYSQTG